MDNKAWTLLAIAAAEGQPLTPVQLQKSLFLLGRNAPKSVGDDFYRFSPYNYGPFCQRVYSDAEILAATGLVRIDRPVGRSWVEYAITDAGMLRASEIRKSVSVEVVSYLQNVVAWCKSLSFQELVSAIYEAYPEQRANSVFR